MKLLYMIPNGFTVTYVSDEHVNPQCGFFDFKILSEIPDNEEFISKALYEAKNFRKHGIGVFDVGI